MKRTLFTLLLFGAFAIYQSAAQQQQLPCGSEGMPFTAASCPNVGMAPGQFQATPFVDTTADVHGNYPNYGDPQSNIVSLYGVYGNDESSPASPYASTHYTLGNTLGSATSIKPLCRNGTPAGNADLCYDQIPAYHPSIVFLFIGFSNCDIEICGGNSDIWTTASAKDPNLLFGQPCATPCPNMNNPNTTRFPNPWNSVDGDPNPQKSLLYQVYSPSQHLVGQHVVIFDGAYGGRTLDHWDPTSAGFWWNQGGCDYGSDVDPECEYARVQSWLYTNSYTEAQVQAVFLKASNANPSCDLKGIYCVQDPPGFDAYIAEQHIGNILRYLRCCKLDDTAQHNSTGISRYPNLKQVFLTSRIYGGYANGTQYPCLNPEPFAFETGFAVQRAVVAQINQDASQTNNDSYSGDLHYNPNPNDSSGGAPWFDWGPYLWASAANKSAGTQLYYCDTTTNPQTYPLCLNDSVTKGDVRYGDLSNPTAFWGDHTHPAENGIEKVAGQLVKFIQGTLSPAQSFTYTWLQNWIHQ